MDYLEMSAHLTVRPGCLEGFKKQAAECIRITKQLPHELRTPYHRLEQDPVMPRSVHEPAREAIQQAG